MRTPLFTLFGVGFPSYFVLLLTGFLFATAAGVIWARRIGQSPDVIVDLGLTMLLAGIAGSRILRVIADGYFWDYVHLCTDPSQVSWPQTQRITSFGAAQPLNSPVSRTPTSFGCSTSHGNPAITSTASAPPTPHANIPRPPAFGVCESVPIISPPGNA